jgi:hypothetical protein
MPRNAFLKIMQDVRDYNSYFLCKCDATGKLNFTSHKKYFATIRILIYGNDGDLIDEYLQMSETPYLNAMYKFYKVVITAYLLSPFSSFSQFTKNGGSQPSQGGASSRLVPSAPIRLRLWMEDVAVDFLE